MSTRIAIVAALVVIAAPVSLAMAQGVGDGSPTNTQHTFSQDGVWYVGGPQDPFAPGGVAYPVSLDPNGTTWIKTLLDSPKGPANGPGILHIHEFIEIVPPPTGAQTPWEDWHEKFVTTGWKWVDFSINIYDFDGYLSDPSMTTVAGLTYNISPDGRDIWFDFDPIFPGTPGAPIVIEIWKSLEYDAALGGDYVPGMPLRIEEYPTPTPGALALLGLGALAMTRRNR